MISNYSAISPAVNKFYEVIESHEVGIDIYDANTVKAVTEFLDNINVQWSLGCSEWPNMEGGICYVSWVGKDNILCMEAFEYTR